MIHYCRLVLILFVVPAMLIKGYAGDIEFTLERPFSLTTAQEAAPKIVLVTPSSVNSASIKVEGDSDEDALFSLEVQSVELRKGNQRLTIDQLTIEPEQARFNNQSLIMLNLGGQVQVSASQSPGNYTGQAYIRGRYLQGNDNDTDRFPVNFNITILARIVATVQRNLNFGQVISGASQTQIDVPASSSDSRAGCISVQGEGGNDVKINYTEQVQLQQQSGSNTLPATIRSSVDSNNKVLVLANSGNGQVCFGGLLTVPAQTTPAEYRGRVDVQLFYP